MNDKRHVRLRRRDTTDHLREIQVYLEATKGLWPRIARELQELGVPMTVPGLHMLCRGVANPSYRRAMAVYDYCAGPGKRWLPIVSRRKHLSKKNDTLLRGGNIEVPQQPLREPQISPPAPSPLPGVAPRGSTLEEWQEGDVTWES